MLFIVIRTASVCLQEMTQSKVGGVRFGGGSVRSTVSNASSVESSHSAVTAGSVHTDSNASFISQVRYHQSSSSSCIYHSTLDSQHYPPKRGINVESKNNGMKPPCGASWRMAVNRKKTPGTSIIVCPVIFTARCYAKLPLARASRLSVRPSVRMSVTLRCRDHLEFFENNFTISWPGVFALRRPQHHGSTPKRTPRNFGRNRWLNRSQN